MKFRCVPTALVFLITLTIGAPAFSGSAHACRDLFGVDRRPPAETSIEQDESLGFPATLKRVTGTREKSHYVRLIDAKLEPKTDEFLVGFTVAENERGQRYGHVFLMTSEYRLDGTIARRPWTSTALLSDANAVLFRFKLDNPEQIAELNRLIRHDGESPFRGFRLTCVHAVCAPLERAQIPQLSVEYSAFQNFVLLSSAYRHMLALSQAPQSSGAPSVDVIGDMSLAQFNQAFAWTDRRKSVEYRLGAALYGSAALAAIFWYASHH